MYHGSEQIHGLIGYVHVYTNVKHFYCLYRDIVECSLFNYPAVQVRFSSRAVGIFLHPVTKSKKLFLSFSQYIFVVGLWLVICFIGPQCGP